MPTARDLPVLRAVAPLASNWQTFAWDTGRFDTAQRSLTPVVEGTIRVPQYLVLATLQGGADRLQIVSACGHRYDGPERVGAISLVPPQCERRLRLENASLRWASLAVDAEVVARAATAMSAGEHAHHCRSNIDDPFLFALMCELQRLLQIDGLLDLSYCEAIAMTVAHYVANRYGRARTTLTATAKLSRWQVTRVAEYVQANIEQPIRVAELAKLVGLSDGYFHRAFRASTGVTPLDFVNERRIRRAIELLNASERPSVIDVAFRVGFTSPQYFARVFRFRTGMNPSAFVARLSTRG
jgi:AraC family transcriptional regulator